MRNVIKLALYAPKETYGACAVIYHTTLDEVLPGTLPEWYRDEFARVWAQIRAQFDKDQLEQKPWVHRYTQNGISVATRSIEVPGLGTFCALRNEERGTGRWGTATRTYLVWQFTSRFNFRGYHTSETKTIADWFNQRWNLYGKRKFVDV